MRAIVTVVGKDRVGIIADVCGLLAEHGVNVLDISQTVLQDYFTMIMLVDTAGCDLSFAELGPDHEGAGGNWASRSTPSGRTSHAMHRYRV
jgi:ACT domain-containing protein